MIQSSEIYLFLSLPTPLPARVLIDLSCSLIFSSFPFPTLLFRVWNCFPHHSFLCKFLSLLRSWKTKPGLQCLFSTYPGMCFKGQKLRIAVHSIWECELSLAHLGAQTVPPSMRPHTSEGRASSFCPSLTRRSTRSSHPVSPLILQLHAIFPLPASGAR